MEGGLIAPYDPLLAADTTTTAGGAGGGLAGGGAAPVTAPSSSSSSLHPGKGKSTTPSSHLPPGQSPHPTGTLNKLVTVREPVREMPPINYKDALAGGGVVPVALDENNVTAQLGALPSLTSPHQLSYNTHITHIYPLITLVSILEQHSYLLYRSHGAVGGGGEEEGHHDARRF